MELSTDQRASSTTCEYTCCVPPILMILTPYSKRIVPAAVAKVVWSGDNLKST